MRINGQNLPRGYTTISTISSLSGKGVPRDDGGGGPNARPQRQRRVPERFRNDLTWIG